MSLQSTLAAALLGALLATSAAQAACLTDGVVLFPRPGATIPTNSVLILEGRGTDAGRAGALIGKTLYLKSDAGDTVTVEVRKGWQSEMGRLAVRLVPKSALKTGVKYTLMLDSVMPGWKNLDERAAELPYWRIGPKADKARPTWRKLPAPAEGRYSVDDGKVNREVRFDLDMNEETPTYVVVTIKRASGNQNTQTYFAPVDGRTIAIGHDGCSGGFNFDDGRAYFAQIEGFDVAGNRAPPTKKLQFHAPKAP